MDRAEALARLGDRYDVLIIGGGATGLGAAVDAATRGYRTVLVTADDFSQGSSSRSTKLIHGGVRYLERGDIMLVRDSLRERSILLRNAPHLVRELRFLIPCYRLWQVGYYGAGLKAYDFLAGSLNLTTSAPVGRKRALAMAPTVRSQGLKGGVLYSDAQFDDARLAIALAQTAHREGAVVASYAAATRLIKERGRVAGAVVLDQVGGREYTVRARAVVNATGIFTDALRRMDDAEAAPILTHSRGAHLVLDHRFLTGRAGILVPRTDDGRVIFILPWEGRTLVGTTDIPVASPQLEPVASEEEIEFLLDHAARYLATPPRREDVLAAFAGLRPLVGRGVASTARLSRDHTLLVSEAGLITITGGKWTTYRRMAQDAVTRAAYVGGLPPRPPLTESLTLAGAGATDPRWRELGATGEEIFRYEAQHAGLLHPRLPYSTAMAAYVIDREMPVNLDDMLSRRLRALVLDAAASVEAAPLVARLMAERQGHDDAWVRDQVRRYVELARGYGVRSQEERTVGR